MSKYKCISCQNGYEPIGGHCKRCQELMMSYIKGEMRKEGKSVATLPNDDNIKNAYRDIDCHHLYEICDCYAIERPVIQHYRSVNGYRRKDGTFVRGYSRRKGPKEKRW